MPSGLLFLANLGGTKSNECNLLDGGCSFQIGKISGIPPFLTLQINVLECWFCYWLGFCSSGYICQIILSQKDQILKLICLVERY